MPCAVQRATAADVPYSMSSGCATTQSTRWKESSGRAGNVMPPSFQNCSRLVMDRPARVRLRQHEPIFARWRRMTRPHRTGSGQMRVIVVIASPTRGFTTPRDGTPTVINPCPSTQDQDEKPHCRRPAETVPGTGIAMKVKKPSVSPITAASIPRKVAGDLPGRQSRRNGPDAEAVHDRRTSNRAGYEDEPGCLGAEVVLRHWPGGPGQGVIVACRSAAQAGVERGHDDRCLDDRVTPGRRKPGRSRGVRSLASDLPVPVRPQRKLSITDLDHAPVQAVAD